LFGEAQVLRQVGGLAFAAGFEQAGLVQDLARPLVVVRADHPDRRLLAGIMLAVAVAEGTAAAAVPAAALGDLGLDAGLGEHLLHALDVLQPVGSEDLTHQRPSLRSGSTRIRPSWAVEATSWPSRR